MLDLQQTQIAQPRCLMYRLAFALIALSADYGQTVRLPLKQQSLPQLIFFYEQVEVVLVGQPIDVPVLKLPMNPHQFQAKSETLDLSIIGFCSRVSHPKQLHLARLEAAQMSYLMFITPGAP
jgi:hypothetical protein